MGANNRATRAGGLPSATGVALVGLAAFGCGSGDISLTGSVKLDGSPLADAFVSLTPAQGGRPVSATTDASGVFRFGEGSSPALPAGEYSVTVTKVETPGLSESDAGGMIPVNVDPGMLRERWVTPRKYAKPSTSGLTATVEHSMSGIELDLTAE